MFNPYLFACWKVYGILRKFVPGPKHPLANKLFDMLVSTVAPRGFGPYHGMWLEDTQTKCMGVIPTPWVMACALGLGVLPPPLE